MAETTEFTADELKRIIASATERLDSDPDAAAEQAREAIRRAPSSAAAHRLLAAALRKTGRDGEADRAELDAIGATVNHPVLASAAAALRRGDAAAAERQLAPYAAEDPDDAGALRLRGNAAAMLGRHDDAERLLRRVLELARAFNPARADLARVLYAQGRPGEAMPLLDEVLKAEPDHKPLRALKTMALVQVGRFDDAIVECERTLAATPDDPQIWMSYGHLLKTVGRADDAVAAYRKSLALRPTQGVVWWSLAELKTARLDKADVATMESALAEPGLSAEDRFLLHFALGKASEDAGRYEASFKHYAQGNRLRRAMLRYDPSEPTDHVRRSIALFTAPFFSMRNSQGCPAADPIFIIGMPRSGSTLVEQILASHPHIEGTMELADLPQTVQRIVRDAGGPAQDVYHRAIAALDADALRAAGEAYLASTRVQRKTDRPLFIDKLPANWLHVGLIHLILPSAKIIDVRRHPLGCCFSNFTQHFDRGQRYAYDLTELGLYYRDYVRLLAHFDAVLPGRVHRIIYEELVADPQAEIRRLLVHVGVPFDPACLAFHENRRAVHTPSAEQVRQPINRKGIERWRPYEPWLGPLKTALGPVLDAYPGAPQSWDESGSPVQG